MYWVDSFCTDLPVDVPLFLVHAPLILPGITPEQLGLSVKCELDIAIRGEKGPIGRLIEFRGCGSVFSLHHLVHCQCIGLGAKNML